MKQWINIAAGLAGLSAAAGLGMLGIRRLNADRQWREIAAALQQRRAGATFDPAMLDGLPAPARRYLRHAIAEGTPLARRAEIDMSGRMKPRPDAAFVDLTAEQLLAPPIGFQWKARLSMGPIPVWVRDHYYRANGAVSVEPIGLPVQRSTGPHVARSARHRLAAESVWMPSALLPGLGVAWEALDDRRARVALTVDGEAIPLTLAIDEAGRLQQVTMQRYGDVDVPEWQLIPYGFHVEDEATFGGYTVPSQLRGGWWFGTDRYRPNAASTFSIRAIRYR